MDIINVLPSAEMTERVGFKVGWLLLACVIFYVSSLLLIHGERVKLYNAMILNRYRLKEKIHEIRVKIAERIKENMLRKQEEEKRKNEKRKELDD